MIGLILIFMTNSYSYKRVHPDEAKEFFDLRMVALKTDPDAFVATMEEEQKLTKEDIQYYLKKNYVLGAYASTNELIGVLVFMEQERQKFSHIGILGGMYVHKNSRRYGIARELIQRMIVYLREHHKNLYGLQLKVVTTNIPAIRLYESFGFHFMVHVIRLLSLLWKAFYSSLYMLFDWDAFSYVT